MIREHPAMREIHEIMEKTYEEDKNLERDELLKKIHVSAKNIMDEYGMNLKPIRKMPLGV